MATSSSILQSYLNTLRNKEISMLDPKMLLILNKKMKGGDFLIPLNFYLGILDDTDRVMFNYMDEKQKDAIRHNLIITVLLLHAEREYELDRQKTENKAFYDERIKRCNELLDALDPAYEEYIKKSPEQAYLSEENPFKYLAIYLAKWFSDQITDLMNGVTKSIKALLGALNDKRLYWVWASALLKTLISLVPVDYYNGAQAVNVIKAPDPYTGCLSWALYYFRFSLNLFLLLKHTIKGPWMSEEEAKIPVWERFLTQWEQRKFTLLNDSLWATANLLSYFWLCGKGALGASGDLLTIVLLVFDLRIAIWDFEEQKTKHNKELFDFDKDIATLEQAIKDHNFGNVVPLLADEEQTDREKMERELKNLKQAKALCKKNWEYQQINLYTNIAYALGLLFAFILLTTPFMPIPGAVAAAIGLAGAILCFAFNAINNAIKGGLEIYRTYEEKNETRKEYNAKFNELIQLISEDDDLDKDQKKLIYLEIKKLQTKIDCQKQKMKYQVAHLIRSIMLEVLLPAIIFASFVYFPLGIGLGVLGAVIALAIATHYLIETTLKSDKQELTFKEEEYKKFCAKSVTEKPSMTFFKSEKKETKTLGDEEKIAGNLLLNPKFE